MEYRPIILEIHNPTKEVHSAVIFSNDKVFEFDKHVDTNIEIKSPAETISYKEICRYFCGSNFIVFSKIGIEVLAGPAQQDYVFEVKKNTLFGDCENIHIVITSDRQCGIGFVLGAMTTVTFKNIPAQWKGWLFLYPNHKI